MLIRPPAAEVPPFFRGYVDAVPDSPSLPEVLATQLVSFPALLRRFPDEAAAQTYAPGKWTLKQSIEHVSDTERIFAYRLLRIARGDQTPLPGFDQDLFVANSHAAVRAWSEIIAEYEAVRRATLALLPSVSAEAWARLGTSSGTPSSARLFAYVIAGHVNHHAAIIESRYAPALLK